MKKAMRLLVYEKYNGHCAYCGKEIAIEDMQVDHITPKRKGGKDTLENYDPSCYRCNHYKRSMDYGIVKCEPFDGTFYFEKMEGEK